MKRVLITGPTHGAERYADAARNAGWKPIEFPLLRIEFASAEFAPIELELARNQPFDLIAVTSSNAAAFLAKEADAVRTIPCAAVGSHTADRLRQHGFEVTLESHGTAEDLANAIIARTPGNARILWARGNLARRFGQILREAGRGVCDIEVYVTRSATELEPPACEAVFLASPSAARFLRGTPALVFAIGPTTAKVVQERFDGSTMVVLDQPSPIALERALARLA